MSVPGAAWKYRHLQAPTADGGVLIDPPWSECLARVLRGAFSNDAAPQIAFGKPWIETRAAARRELIAAAIEYTRSYRDVDLPNQADAAAAPLVMAGHQPEMFHAGVWMKNFVIDALARSVHGTALNLIVDSDVARSAALRVPDGSPSAPVVEVVPFDAASPELPHEERAILDESLWSSFARRVEERIAPFVAEPLLNEYWPLVLGRSRATRNIGACLAQSRHQLEGQWGLNTLELPQSSVCKLHSFHQFAACILGDASRFQEMHNAALADYRRANRVRSHAHPVPELIRDGESLETPFWVWRADRPRRRRLFVQHGGMDIVLSDRDGWEQRIAAGCQPGEVSEAAIVRVADELHAIGRSGVKIRGRALVTTLFARLFMADLFVHGLGGAKYDQLTDLLITQFFTCNPPPYAVATATLRLPIDANEKSSVDDLRRAQSTLRDLQFHPEVFLTGNGVPSDVMNWIAHKRKWIATAPTLEQAHTRSQEIRRANESLQPYLANERVQALRQVTGLGDALRAERILGSREYAFCLHPTENLRTFLLEKLLPTP